MYIFIKEEAHMPVTKIIVGFFVGLLCGLDPLIYGLLSKHRALAVGGIAAAALAGALFNFLDKSPFSAMVVAILFVIIIIANNKRRSKLMQEDEDDDDIDDIHIN